MYNETQMSNEIQIQLQKMNDELEAQLLEREKQLDVLRIVTESNAYTKQRIETQLKALLLELLEDGEISKSVARRVAALAEVELTRRVKVSGSWNAEVVIDIDYDLDYLRQDFEVFCGGNDVEMDSSDIDVLDTEIID